MTFKYIKTIILVACTGSVLGCASSGPDMSAYDDMADIERAYSKGDYYEAEKGYMELMKKMPNDPYAYFKLGNSLVKQNKFDEALKAYHETLKRDNSYSKAYNNIATVYLLKAELSLEAAVNSFPNKHKSVSSAKKKLNALRKISRMPLTDVQSPLANYKVIRVINGTVEKN